MLRVFLVIDDYNELISLQTLLKKMGFDVEGLQNQKKYPDVSLGFNPQILITTSYGKKVDGLLLAQSINKRRGLPKILALKTDNTYTQDDFERSGVDLVLDSPVDPKKLISAMANLGGIDESVLLDKFSRIKSMPATSKHEEVEYIRYDENGQPLDDFNKVRSSIDEIVRRDRSGGVNKTVENKMALKEKTKYTELLAHNSIRTERFEKWKKEVGELPEKHFDREKIREFNKKFRVADGDSDTDDIEEARKLFVKALFKKNPN